MKYYIVGYLKLFGQIVCTCVAGVTPDGDVYNMRGGLEYMREIEIYPCHRHASFKAMQAKESEIHNGRRHVFKWSGEVHQSAMFYPCEPVPVSI